MMRVKKFLFICSLSCLLLVSAACAATEPPTPAVESEAATTPAPTVGSEATTTPAPAAQNEATTASAPAAESEAPATPPPAAESEAPATLAPIAESKAPADLPSQDGPSLPAFSAQDIYGQAVDNSLFADHDLTMLNIWGTFCSPCIREMPDLGELAAAMPAGTQLMGLVGDALNEENIALAQSITQESGAAFTQIVPDQALFDFLNNNIVAYPTTLFIDSAGHIVGEPVIGMHSRAQYEAELQSRLNSLQ